MLTPTTAEAWRKASPDPSESSTKPYRFPGLNHFSLPQTVGAGGSPTCVSASCGGTSGWLKGSPLSPFCAVYDFGMPSAAFYPLFGFSLR